MDSNGRESRYNATVVHVRRVHDALRVIRVRGDDFVPPVVAGQYTVLGLGDWEPRLDGLQRAEPRGKLVQRAYSVSAPLLDEHGELARVRGADWLEFYVALVKSTTDDPPPLTPRLFALGEGDRCYMGPSPKGRYTLEPVGPKDNVVLCATGTGEAPHNAMLAELLASGHSASIVSAVCVRYEHDLAYESQHRELERRYPNYQYHALTTREPRNLDASREDFVGKQYLQSHFADDVPSSWLGFDLDPARTHVFLCGNPAMIGLPRRSNNGTEVFPEPAGMAETLVGRGFRLDAPRRPGNVHFEKYW